MYTFSLRTKRTKYCIAFFQIKNTIACLLLWQTCFLQKRNQLNCFTPSECDVS